MAVDFEIETLPPEAGDRGERCFALRGRLHLAGVERLRETLSDRIADEQDVRLDLSGVESLDGSAAAVLAQVWTSARCSGRSLQMIGARAEVAAVLDLYTARAPRDCDHALPEGVGILDGIGAGTIAIRGQVQQMLSFVGELSIAVARAVRDPSSIYWRSVARLTERVGADGLPIVGTIAFLIGLIIAFQSAVQLRQFGADVFVAEMVAISLTRELGPLMAAIVVAGRSGASIAAEVGTMQVSEEVDALRTMGFCPMRYLVVPRVLALIIALPLLTLFADAIGIAGGVLIAMFQLEQSVHGYLLSTAEALDAWDIYSGVIKAVFFGAIVAIVACERGMSTRGGAEGVGRSTTSAVVTILFYLVVADSGFVILFNLFGL